MKLTLLAVLLVSLLLATSASTVSAQYPIPQGVREADKAEAHTEKNIPPPANSRPAVDLAKVGQEADELAKIAQTIPPDVASMQKGMLPKDVIQKLKEIEKLSKHLRSELNP